MWSRSGGVGTMGTHVATTQTVTCVFTASASSSFDGRRFTQACLLSACQSGMCDGSVLPSRPYVASICTSPTRSPS